MRAFRRGYLGLVLVSFCALAGAARAQDWAGEQVHEAAPAARPCPDSVAALASCYGGQDANGAYYLIARPHQPNVSLVVHAHGGPRLTAPAADDPDEDLDRFAVMVADGYAWIGSSYRREGYGVRRAAADVDHSRALYWRVFGRPERTFLHGQSWGGQIAAKAAELYAFSAEGDQIYDGVLITNGLLAGAVEAYAFRFDLRVVYQFYCANHPTAEEAQYPLWHGLPPGATLTRQALRERVESCTGLQASASARSPSQARALANILAVTGVQERALMRHLEWATFTFPSLIAIAGGNPFDNRARVYSGSDDDAALNAGVQRFAADPQAQARLAYDSEPSGLIAIPVLSLHAIDDPVASVGLQDAYARTIARAGRDHLFLGLRVQSDDHSRMPPGLVGATLATLQGWSDSASVPNLDAIAAACLARGSGVDECSLLRRAEATRTADHGAPGQSNRSR